LESSLYWLSEDIVRFKIEVGVEEKCPKLNHPMFNHSEVINDVIIVGRRLLHTFNTRDVRM